MHCSHRSLRNSNGEYLFCVRDSTKTVAALIRAAELIKAHLKSVDRDKTTINSKLVRPMDLAKTVSPVVIADTVSTV